MKEDGQEFGMRALLTGFHVAGYKPGDVIFCQGDPCDSVMYIEGGQVRLAITAASGREGVCGIVGAGGFLGEEAISGHTVQRHTAVAMTEAHLLVVKAAQMIQLLRTESALSDRFLAHVVARHMHLEADLADQLLNQSRKRVARTLLALAEEGGPSPYPRALPHVSQEIIAEIVGTTRSRVNGFMTEFKRRGFITTDRGELQVTPSLSEFVDGP
ncbi:MAG: Crp/Fnr family transcriptional regulator [Vicinamibacterales bacterium]